MFGDSQAAGLARGLQRVLAEDPRFRVLNRTHAGASLVHDESEWLAPIAQFTEREKADIAIVMFGANDRIDMREGRTTLRFRGEPSGAPSTPRESTRSSIASPPPGCASCGSATRSRAASATPRT